MNFNLHNKQVSNNNASFIKNKHNGFLISVLTVLYILFINKIADMLSSSNEDEDSKNSSYVMIIYFLTIMGFVIAYVWIKNKSNGDYVIRKSLTFGGTLMLLYTIFSYWEHLDDYAKLIMLILSIGTIVYYAY
jgi:hypothetical protein